jgi:hypothetical protein
MKSFATILILCFFVSLPVTAREITIKHKFMEGTLVLTIDNAKIDPEVVRKYLVVHPIAYDSNYHIAPSIRLCIEKDPRYFPCGTRDYSAEYFLKNAQVNIDIGLERLDYLTRLNEIQGLRRLVAYFRNSLSFSIWKEQKLFSYYRSWNIDVLKEQYTALPFSSEVSESLRSLEHAKTTEKKWNISFYNWSNAINNLYRNQEGDIPRSEWDDFLKKYGISEHIEWDEVD